MTVPPGPSGHGVQTASIPSWMSSTVPALRRSGNVASMVNWKVPANGADHAYSACADAPGVIPSARIATPLGPTQLAVTGSKVMVSTWLPRRS